VKGVVNTPMLCASAKGQEILFFRHSAKVPRQARDPELVERAGIQSLQVITKTWTPFFNGVTACSETLMILQSQNRFDHPTVHHIFHRLVDVIERVEGDQFVEGEPPLAVKIKKSGNEQI
jgi:hypothetical protein